MIGEPRSKVSRFADVEQLATVAIAAIDGIPFDAAQEFDRER